MAGNGQRGGRNGRILVDTSSAGTSAAVLITSKNKWTLDQKVDTIEVTSMEDTNKEYVVGLPDAQGTIEGFWDNTDQNVYNLIGSSVARKLYIYPDASNNIGTYFFTTAFFSTKWGGDVKTAVDFGLTFNAASPAAWVHA